MLNTKRIPLGNGPFDTKSANKQPTAVSMIDIGALVIPQFPCCYLSLISQGTEFSAVNVSNDGGGRLMLSLYANPKSGGMLDNFIEASRGNLLQAGAVEINQATGLLGEELTGKFATGECIQFVGVEGPRWLLGGVCYSEAKRSIADFLLMRKILSYTVVNRGEKAHALGEVIPLSLPAE
ncbi:MAG: DUF3710 domain-containing protein [Mycobacteriaceae bacterium]